MKVFRFTLYIYRCIFFNINGLVQSSETFSEYTIGSAQSITSKEPHESGAHQRLSLLFTLPNYSAYIYI